MCSGTRGESALEQHSVEETCDPAARFVLDDESVHEALAVGPEVALMLCVRQAGLRTGVGHEPVRPERSDRHRQLAFAPQRAESSGGPCRRRLPSSSPLRDARTLASTEASCYVRDEREASFDWHRKVVLALDPNHSSIPDEASLRSDR